MEMLSVIPPIFILLGLLNVWVQRETMIKLMGEKSGILGILIAFFLGSAAAGPFMLIAYITERLLNEKKKQYIYDSASR